MTLQVELRPLLRLIKNEDIYSGENQHTIDVLSRVGCHYDVLQYEKVKTLQ